MLDIYTVIYWSNQSKEHFNHNNKILNFHGSTNFKVALRLWSTVFNILWYTNNCFVVNKKCTTSMPINIWRSHVLKLVLLSNLISIMLGFKSGSWINVNKKKIKLLKYKKYFSRSMFYKFGNVVFFPNNYILKKSQEIRKLNIKDTTEI